MQAAGSEFRASSARRGGEKMALKGYKDYKRSMAKGVPKKSKARARKLVRFLDDEDRVEKPKRMRDMRLDFGTTAHLGRSVITLEDLSIGYEPQALLLHGVRRAVSPGARLVISGPNGSGKTTLLRTIAGGLPPLAGKVELVPSVRMGVMTQEQTNRSTILTSPHANSLSRRWRSSKAPSRPWCTTAHLSAVSPKKSGGLKRGS